MDRISTRTDPDEIGDEPDPWDEFLEGRLDFLDLSEADQARARSFGLASEIETASTPTDPPRPLKLVGTPDFTTMSDAEIEVWVETNWRNLRP